MNNKKKDFFAIGIYCLITIVMVLLTIKGKYLYGSTLDFESQHFRIPEYFRLLFYNTHDLFPDFALNLGGGQNIYNLSYYGFLSPVILLSYIMPNVSMLTFINVSSVLLVLISSVLFYFFLKTKEFDFKICFLCGLIFLCASPLLFHTHRHIMYVNYMPFLILGLFGVDRLLKNNKSLLLIISVFLMIMTSYYFSVSGILVLVVYGIYNILDKKISFKTFVKSFIKLCIPIFIAVLMSSALIVPTFYALLVNRSDTVVNISILDLIIPKMNNNYIFYYQYGLGLSSIVLFSLCNCMFSNRNNKKYLSILLFMFILFPFFNYFINATMYIDSKVLIPFLPLYVLIIAYSLKDIFSANVNKKIYLVFLVFVIFAVFGKNGKFIIIDSTLLIISLLLCINFKKRFIIPCYIIISSISISLIVNNSDNLIVNDEEYVNSFKDIKEVVKNIVNNDDDVYRISVQENKLQNINNVFDINYYSSTIYSSLNNQLYNSYYYDYMTNEIQSRNRSIVSSVNNNLFLLASGNKYIVSNGRKLIGYNFVERFNGYNVYKNDNVLPLGYVSNNFLSNESFDNLNKSDKKIALYRNVIVDDFDVNNYVSYLSKLDVDFNDFTSNNVKINKLENGYVVKASEDTIINIPLSDKLNDKIMFINFDVLKSWKCKYGDLIVEINGVVNKLTCGNWKYHNNNYNFEYVIADDNRKGIDIKLKKGEYYFDNLEVYYANYEDILFNDYDKFNVSEINGDIIYGNINSRRNGYFVLNIPYDEGFIIKVDGNKINYENVNKGLIGFKINSGYHDIEIEYKAPYKNIGIILSVIGFTWFGIYIFIEKRKRF